MSAQTRDLRLDFFRGLSLLFIFVDHIPGNFFSYFTLANFVFSDAAEIFVFISGYTAAVAFGAMAVRSGMSFAIVQVLRRCWTLYVAHIFLFVLFTAQVAYTAEKFANPMFVDEMKVAGFLQEPHIAIVKALSLQFQPEFMGILPLYIVLLLGFAAILPILRSHMTLILAASVLLYIAVLLAQLNLPTYPDGSWFHNPLAWQILFVLGAICGTLAGSRGLAILDNAWLIRAAVTFLAVSVALKLLLLVDTVIDIVPADLLQRVWPIMDKTNLGPLRLLNFLALTLVVVRLVPRESALVRAPAARPIILCGQNSLYIFCLGILLSYLGHLILVEISHALPLQFAVSAGGILIMIAVAAFLAWTKNQARRPELAKPTMPRGTVAGEGGE